MSARDVAGQRHQPAVPDSTVVAVRFTFFAVQAIAMIWVGLAIVARLST